MNFSNFTGTLQRSTAKLCGLVIPNFEIFCGNVPNPYYDPATNAHAETAVFAPTEFTCFVHFGRNVSHRRK